MDHIGRVSCSKDCILEVQSDTALLVMVLEKMGKFC